MPRLRAHHAALRHPAIGIGALLLMAVTPANAAAVASPNTAATGPVEEFNAEGGALGFAEAAPGGRFVKIGVGVLQRPDATPFSPFMRYAIVDQGRRTSRARRDHVVFTHAVADAESGYGYRYVKTLRLLKGLPVMLIEHELHNTGRKPIATRVYNHNFLNIDGVGTRAGLEMTTPFAPIAEQPLDPQFASIDGQRLVYRASPGVEQRVSSRLGGFGSASSDYDFRIIDRASGAGLRITGDQPLDRVVLWSIRPVMSIEPFLMMSIPVGGTHRWTYRYEFSAAGSTAVATTP